MDTKHSTGLNTRKFNLSSGFASNKGADQPEGSRSLISAFVIRFFWKYHI